MIVITGANGRLGRAVAEQLLRLVPASEVGVSVREPQQARDLAARGVRVRQGDFSQPATLAHAFAGAERLLLVSTDNVDALRVEQHRNAISAAKDAGVRHVFYTSFSDIDPASPFPAGAHHAHTEAAIRESGVPFTLLRNGIYMESLALFVGPALTSGVIAAPADGLVAYAARDDLAEVTARLLATGTHIGETLELTGTEAIDLAQAAAIASEIAGQPITRQVLGDAEYRAQLLSAGFPPSLADTFIAIFAAQHEGRFAPVYSSLQELLGRPPLTPQEFIAGLVAAS